MEIIAFTGHRPDKLGNDYDLTSQLCLDIRNRIIKETRVETDRWMPNPWVKTDLHFITGMALGVDQIAAMVAIAYEVPFTAAIPCRGQELKWPQRSQDIYNRMLTKAAKIEYVTDGPYDNFCMQKRNMWMVDQCTRLIAVWDGSIGGTKNCIDYAKKVRKPITIIGI